MNPRVSAVQFRHALPSDIPELAALIENSVGALQAGDYSPEQIEASLGSVFGVDTQLIADRTYFVAEVSSPDGNVEIVGCGGWSMRKTLFGADAGPDREPELLDPETDAARIRAIFVHPAWARQGIGSKILAVCETAAAASGFTRFQMASTLTGLPLYSRHGYQAVERRSVPLSNGIEVPVVLMEKAPLNES